MEDTREIVRNCSLRRLANCSCSLKLFPHPLSDNSEGSPRYSKAIVLLPCEEIIVEEGEMKRILLVNDSKELLELMGTLLQAQGYEPILRSYRILTLNVIVALR